MLSRWKFLSCDIEGMIWFPEVHVYEDTRESEGVVRIALFNKIVHLWPGWFVEDICVHSFSHIGRKKEHLQLFFPLQVTLSKLENSRVRERRKGWQIIVNYFNKKNNLVSLKKKNESMRKLNYEMSHFLNFIRFHC